MTEELRIIMSKVETLREQLYRMAEQRPLLDEALRHVSEQLDCAVNEYYWNSRQLSVQAESVEKTG